MGKLDVVFEASKSTFDNCSCDCCYGLGKVIKLRVPETKYYDGKKLTARYSNLWICHECCEKMAKAIKEAPNE